MKKKAILSALFSAFVACFFVACSNDSDALDINAGTRSVTSSSYMTREEVQTRLDEIGEKYGETIMLGLETDTEKVTENFFTRVEAMCENNNYDGPTESTVELLDDEQIDKITIPKIGTYAAPGESSSGTITKDHSFLSDNGHEWVKVIITWYANTGGTMNKATAELQEVVVDEFGSYSLKGFYHTPIVGDVLNPFFSYRYDIYKYKDHVLHVDDVK
ncbi:MAG: hypothetical protein IJD05_00695 [Bacteroidaceae bacterium]|nr:hypothetical protein [Bacteroidaceae bacterium]